MLDSYIKFIKAHERILAMALTAAVIFGAWGHIETIIQRHDASHEVQVQIVATAQAQKDAALAAQVASDKTAFDALQAQINARDAALVQANTALATALAKRQTTDDGMPDTELVQRWADLVPKAVPSDISAAPHGVVLNDEAAHATVDVLEQVPALTQELSNSNQQTADALALLTSDNKQVTDLNAEVSGLKLKAIDDKNLCNADIKDVKDAARKSKRRWFVIGYVAGFISRQAIKSYLGI